MKTYLRRDILNLQQLSLESHKVEAAQMAIREV